jgi:DNA polymerase-3 subunit gamma/tau
VAHVSLYRKYRSQSFAELIGQDHVVRTLQNALSSGRLSHAYLFTGPRGTGKTSTARLLAKCLCDPAGPTPTPDPDSEISRAIATGSCVDVVEMDAASESGVDDIRQAIVEAVEYRPMLCPYKVYIIDEVHDLSPKAFDALLKTIEEPPPHVVFILATTEYNKVPTTIRSRCQKFEFHRASLKDLVAVLSGVAEKEGAVVEPAALTAIARMADGGYRDALTLLEQLLLTAEGPITVEDVQRQLGLVAEETVDRLLVALRQADIPALYAELDAIAASGRDPRAILESLLYRLSDLTRAAYHAEPAVGVDAPREAALRALAAELGPERLLRYRTAVAEAWRNIRDVSLPRLWVEAQLHALAQPAPTKAAPERAAPVKAPEKSVPEKAVAVKASPAQTEPKPAPKPNTQAEPKPGSSGENSNGAKADSHAAEPHAEDRGIPGPGQDLWRQMLASLPATAHPLKLEGSYVVEAEGATLTIALLRQMDVDWYNENPKRVGYIVSQLKGVADRPWTVKFRLAERTIQPAEPETVELPLEGQALHDRIVAIFNP